LKPLNLQNSLVRTGFYTINQITPAVFVSNNLKKIVHSVSKMVTVRYHSSRYIEIKHFLGELKRYFLLALYLLLALTEVETETQFFIYSDRWTESLLSSSMAKVSHRKPDGW
jgi:hypothetical protein